MDSLSVDSDWAGSHDTWVKGQQSTTDKDAVLCNLLQLM